MQIFVVFWKDNNEDVYCPQENMLKAFTDESKAQDLVNWHNAAQTENTKRWRQAKKDHVGFISADNPLKWDLVPGSMPGDCVFWYDEVELI